MWGGRQRFSGCRATARPARWRGATSPCGTPARRSASVCCPSHPSEWRAATP
jgi:hypothetical protein